MNIQERLAQYAPIRLAADLSPLSAAERRMVPLLIEAARAMDEAFWQQAYGDPTTLLANTDPDTQRCIRLNYGPWDQLRDDEPFVAGVGAKPSGANFYPADMTVAEFEASASEKPALKSTYTLVRRNAHGVLEAIPYHQFFRPQMERAARQLRAAAQLAAEPGLKHYLTLRAAAFLTDDYAPSDAAWMDMKANTLDVLIGPMEVSADRLLWNKAAYAATLLVKDWGWSNQLAHYIRLLPRFQAELPVPEAYKQEQPSLNSDINVYDAIYCAGYDNQSIPLGISWPDNEEVRLRKGTRSLQLKNAIRAKFEHLTLPLANELLAPEQRPQVTFAAYFAFVMFHEIAHGLGIRHTLTGQGLVKDALKDCTHVIEEAKANLLALWLITQRHQQGEMGEAKLPAVSEAELQAVYVSGLAHLFRLWDSRQAQLQLNFFEEMGAYVRDPGPNTYRVQFAQMPAAITALAGRLLRLQGDGDYAGAQALVERYGRPHANLEAAMQRFEQSGHPIEITLVQD